MTSKYDLLASIRSRATRHLLRQLLEWASVIVFVVLASWFVGQWFYNSLH